MSIRLRLFLATLLVTSLGFYLLADWIVEDLRPRYLESMEEGMVDTSQILAALLVQEVRSDAIPVDGLRRAVERARRQRFEAKIYEITKTQINIRILVVNRSGRVVFDSADGKDEGEDYSRWNDVIRTFRGEYGARSTRDDPDNPESSVLYVSAPIRVDDDIVGLVTVAKPTNSISMFLRSAKHKVIVAAILAAVAVVLLGFIV
ncbi:MAG: sensor histidine kinase family protein, partial [Planctomycetota bacterium]